MASTKVTVAHLRVYNYLNSSDNLKDAVLPQTQRLQFTIPYFLTANLDGCDSQSNGYPGDCDPGDRTLNPAGDRPRERPSTHSQCDSVLPQRFPRDQTFGVGHHCESSGHFSNEPVAKVDTSSLVKTQLLAELKTQLDIDLSGVKFPILKLKNHRGSLVPLSLHSFKLSLARQPLDLEILSRFASMVPDADLEKGRCQQKSQVLSNLIKRLAEKYENIEQSLTEPKLQNEGYLQARCKIKEELGDLDRRISGLRSLMDTVSEKEWKGLIARNPLW